MPRICVVTSAHPLLDKRVFQRHAKFLVDAGFEVHLVAPHSAARDEVDGVVVHGFQRRNGYIGRFANLRRIGRLAREVRADLYHLHDPDLLPVGLWLERTGRVPVVYDVHEDFPLAARTSRGLPPVVGALVGGAVGLVEGPMARRLSGIVCAHRPRLEELAAPGQERLFLPNYPPRTIFGAEPVTVRRARSAFYSGLLSYARGAGVILDAAAQSPDIRYVLYAEFLHPPEAERFRADLATRALANVEWNGFVPFAQVPALLAAAGAGLMPWAATPQHLRGAQPSKLYEYMAAALPIVASDLPITRDLVAANACGVLHAPDDPADLVRVLRAVLDDPAGAEAMGRRGRQAFVERYNYESGARALVAMYERLWGRAQGRA